MGDLPRAGFIIALALGAVLLDFSSKIMSVLVDGGLMLGLGYLFVQMVLSHRREVTELKGKIALLEGVKLQPTDAKFIEG